ncbi:ABC transporter ATP-binding protein [Glycomyces arizonensis]|uniref:ABC transporter ATP-binding protein n=1 Tax=Glycomyces arizonensis TaxID=256035 RepID=UPI000411D8EF|nr:ABC transporter ATP-binding protein [Glycomyces arizonensis]
MSNETTSGAPAVELRGVRKHYGEVAAVDGIDLSIRVGEVVALLGPNGAGKSTAIDMILGLSGPDAGSVAVFGRAPTEAVADGAIGAMLQNGTLLDDLTVAETIGLVASLHRSPMPVEQVMRRTGVEDLAKRRANRLSGGQQQRVRFAIALVSDPSLLILDEPTAAMDPAARRDFWKAIYEDTAHGRTVLFATHYLEEAEEFADRVVLMRSGKIVADGPVAQVRAAASGRTIRAVVPGAGEEALGALPAVTACELREQRVRLSSSDSDATLRALLERFPAARDIEIASAGLEDAFLSLTAEPETTR